MTYYYSTYRIPTGLTIQGLTRNFGSGCVENGSNVNYTCTVVDTNIILVSTIWEGSDFNCPPTNDISLQHIRYNTTGDSGICNGGAFSAESVGVVGNEYTSRLTVMASLSLNDTLISCTLAAQVLIDNDIIRVGG